MPYHSSYSCANEICVENENMSLNTCPYHESEISCLKREIVSDPKKDKKLRCSDEHNRSRETEE